MKDDKLIHPALSKIEIGTTINFKPEANRSITFHGEDGDVGKLTWDDGRFHFEGDADESARIFFDAVCSFVGVIREDA